MPEGIRHGAQVRVEVPASSANLGPGFDTLGLGIELRDVVEVDTGHLVPITHPELLAGLIRSARRRGAERDDPEQPGAPR